jgi:hypothetical protein
MDHRRIGVLCGFDSRVVHRGVLPLHERNDMKLSDKDKEVIVNSAVSPLRDIFGNAPEGVTSTVNGEFVDDTKLRIVIEVDATAEKWASGQVLGG